MPDAVPDTESKANKQHETKNNETESATPALDDWGLPIRQKPVTQPFESSVESANGDDATKEDDAFEDAEEQLKSRTPDARPTSSRSNLGAFETNHGRSSSASSRPVSRGSTLGHAQPLDAKSAALRRKREVELQQIKAGTVPKETSRIDARLAARRMRPALDGRPSTPRNREASVADYTTSMNDSPVAASSDRNAALGSSSSPAEEPMTIANTKEQDGEIDAKVVNRDTDIVKMDSFQSDNIKNTQNGKAAAESPIATVSGQNATPTHKRHESAASFTRSHADSVGSTTGAATGASEWSHQQLAPMKEVANVEEKEEDEWQTMPAYAPFNIYNDDGKLVAVEHNEEEEESNAANYNMQLGGAGRGYTRVQMDEDAQSATSMDENTAYLFKAPNTNTLDEEDEGRDMLDQMQTTKSILTGNQRIAYVGIVRLGTIAVNKELDTLDRNRNTKKSLDGARDSGTLWSQKMIIRLYGHMEIEAAEQIMIEQLAEHGVQPDDLTPSLMINARIKNPVRDRAMAESKTSLSVNSEKSIDNTELQSTSKDTDTAEPNNSETAAKEVDVKTKGEIVDSSKSTKEHDSSSDDEDIEDIVPKIKDVTEIEDQQNLELDIRWTTLCDLFLILISDSVYDSRSRRLLETVGGYLNVTAHDICRFEKRITDALEMQEAADKENWNEEDHMEERRKQDKKRRMMMMGLATVGGGLVIGLSAGLLAPLIGAGLAAGFTTFGVAGTGSFLAGAGGAAIITTTGIVTGSNIGFNASNRRTGSVKTFEYRPLHNNKRVNLIVTVAGWMTGKVDDVRLPFSTVDPIMGDIYSVFWEPEMLQSMGDTINILATEALTQALQQVLGSTILVTLMAAIQLPIVLTKLAYLIDNPWTVSLARADLAGLILADSLIDRNLGARPITLVGFSLGSRVIYACLRELAKRGQYGIIQNVYMFGSPIVIKKDEYTKILSIVSGRFVNGFATNDWILGYLFRATGGGVMPVAGLSKVDHPRIENYNVTEFVPGHMSYRKMMPRLLREVGWLVESDEFSEIEDPDPENHEKRQRELIDEIEEARRALDEKEKKGSRFNWFRRKRIEASEKKGWETYDEQVRNGTVDDKEALEAKAAGTALFDIEALQREIAMLAAEGVQVKELPQSTLPPMKIDLSSSSASGAVFTPPRRLSNTNGDRSHSISSDQGITVRPPLHSVKTEADVSPVTKTSSFFGFGKKTSSNVGIAAAAATAGTAAGVVAHDIAPTLERSVTAPEVTSPKPPAEEEHVTMSFASPTSVTSNTAPIDLNHNAWADEEEFGAEKEVTMTFE